MRENRIYFIVHSGRIKIGVSGDVKRRMGEIGKHLDQKIELLGDISGGYDLEKYLHNLLAKHALGREWFNDCAEVRAVVQQVLDGENFGFVPRSQVALRQAISLELTFDQWLARFNKFAKLVFPKDTVDELASFLDTTPEQVQRYLLGEDELPDLLWKAFSGHVVQWVMIGLTNQNLAKRGLLIET